MNDKDLKDLLLQSDEIISSSEEFAEISVSAIENEEIRELGRIVLESSPQDCAVFSCT